MKKRIERHDIIRTIVREQEIRTQRDLVDALRSEGYECTQATVSRDISDMDLVKADEGVYMLREDLHFKRLAHDLVIDVILVDIFVIIKTHSGMAQGVAAAIDGARLDHVLGTIAGDDTILIITGQADEAAQLVSTINVLRTDSPSE